MAMFLKNGTMSSVSADTSAEVNRNTATDKPTTDCQKYFQRATRPALFLRDILR